MDHHRGPRANRSKKTLPAAFGGGGRRENRHVSPHGDKQTEWSPRVQLRSSRRPSKVESPPFPQEGFDQPLPAEALRLDALIFLSSCPQKHGNFAIKKMLHPTTLELFCLMEIPGAEHQRAILQASLQAWLSRWHELQVEHPHFLVAVRETFWDVPQGYPMAILCEYMPLGSLDDLIQASGGLPEEAMREIAQMVLESLNLLHSVQPPVVHGCLKPSQVLFSAAGKPRLTFGLEQRIKACQASIVAAAAGAVGPEPSPSELTTAVDIFDLGLLLLVSALGGMDVLLDAIPYARKYGSQPTRGPGAESGDTCSLLLNELKGGAEVMSPASGSAEMGYLPPASDLLFNRHYSGPFLSFVSTCLEVQTQQNLSASHLLQHDFLQTQAQQGPLVSLREMMGLARALNEAPEHDPNRFGPGTRRGLVPGAPGLAPSVAQSAQLYLMNIAQSIAPHCIWSPAGVTPKTITDGPVGRQRALSDGTAAAVTRPRWRYDEWETLLTDTAKTLGLGRNVVQSALEAQLERLLQISAR